MDELLNVPVSFVVFAFFAWIAVICGLLYLFFTI